MKRKKVNYVSVTLWVSVVGVRGSAGVFKGPALIRIPPPAQARQLSGSRQWSGGPTPPRLSTLIPPNVISKTLEKFIALETRPRIPWLLLQGRENTEGGRGPFGQKDHNHASKSPLPLLPVATRTHTLTRTHTQARPAFPLAGLTSS